MTVPLDKSDPTQPSLGKLVQDATEQISTLVHGEIELAKLELKVSAKRGGAGIAMFAAAAVLLVFALTFLFIAIAEVLHRYLMPRWAAYLVVFGLITFGAIILGILGYKSFKKVRAPERTIKTSKDTAAYLRHPTQKA